MSKPDQDEPKLPTGVLSIGPELAGVDLDRALQAQEAADDSWVLHEVLGTWKSERDLDRTLRKDCATLVLKLLLLESGIAGIAFFLIGFQLICVEKWVANVFFVAVFSQIALAAHSVIRYLFPAGRDDALPVEIVRLRAAKTGARRGRR